jgi:hypothetical protein
MVGFQELQKVQIQNRYDLKIASFLGPKNVVKKSLCPKIGNDQVSDLPTAGESGESVGLVMQRDIFLQVTLHDTRLYKTQMQY